MPLNEYEFPTSKIANVQSQLEKLVEKNYYLHQSAKDAYRGYILAYNSHQLKDIFNVHVLDLRAVSRSFGFTMPPKASPLMQHQMLHTGTRLCKLCCWSKILSSALAVSWSGLAHPCRIGLEQALEADDEVIPQTSQPNASYT